MDIKVIHEYLAEDWAAVKESIVDALRSDISLLNSTNDSILSNSGKQLRPLLALVLARVCSGSDVSPATIRYAAASEILHNATLLHDDVADDSSQRRGVPTIMSLMGPAVSVLVGDYWLVKAMELILQGSDTDVRAIKIFSKTLSDLAEGEILQLQKAQTGDTTEEDYLRIIYNKTASLFEATCLSAAISVGASEQMQKAAVDYAIALGIAFQIKDDILDYSGTEAVGKPLGADILEQKITIPLLGALAVVDAQEQARVRTLIRDIVGHPEFRDDIVKFVIENGGIEYAEQKLNEYVDKAVRALDIFPESTEKGFLVQLAHFTAKRDK